MNTLLTGYSGFLGSAISIVLNKEFKLIRLGRQYDADLKIDLQNSLVLPKGINHIIHAAGLAHLSGIKNNLDNKFHLINVIGTLNLLNAIDYCSLNSMIFISSVSVYGSNEGTYINEEHPLLANDPYGKSKIEAEKLIMEFSYKHSIPILILRLPLLCGPNPPGNLGTMIKSIRNRTYFRINHGTAQKSLLHIQDVAYLCCSWLSQNHKKYGIYNLTDGLNPSIADIENSIASYFGIKIHLDVPKNILKLPSLIGDCFHGFPLNSKRLTQLTSSLTFDDNKAKKELNWNPLPALSYPWTV